MKLQDARATRSRSRLIEAGRKLLNRNPQASLSEVAVAASVGRATLYRHFETREELIQAIARECFQLTSEALSPIHNDPGLSARQKLEKGIRVLMPMADSYHFLLSLWNLAEHDYEVLALYQQQMDALTDLITQAQAAGDIRTDVPASWIATLIDSQIYSAWWLLAEGRVSVQEAGDFAVKTLFEGIGA